VQQLAAVRPLEHTPSTRAVLSAQRVCTEQQRPRGTRARAASARCLAAGLRLLRFMPLQSLGTAQRAKTPVRGCCLSLQRVLPDAQ
jgi:hypothetical protein